jgi:Carboxypeptidase regulatory-like domain
MIMFRQLRTLLVSFFVLAFCSPMFAQSAQVQGQVTDSSGAVIPKALVRVVDQKTLVERQTETDGSGQYSVPALNPSTYKIFVQASGFSSAVSNVVTLNVAQNALLDFKLQIGTAASEVQVNASNLSTNTTDATVSTVIDRQFVENLPLNGRSFQSLIALTPGVVFTPSDAGSDQGQFSVAGQRAGSNYFTLDGVSVNFGAAVAQYQAQNSNGGLPAFSAFGGTSSLVSVDALQEFRMETSTYAPEYGRESGSQVMLATRSGTNRFHGTAFEYLRNDALDANDWFANNTGQPTPRERQNDFGGVVGGPIFKDKTFFFFSYEGLRVTQPLFQLSDVPSLAARAAAAPDVKDLINAFPLPNGPATDPNLNQLAASAPNASTLNATSIRVDHSLNARITLFGRYNHAPSTVNEAYGGYPGSNPFHTIEDIDTGTLGVTAVVSSNMTNDFRFNYSRAHGYQHAGFDDFGGAVTPPASSIFSPFQDPLTSNAFYVLETGRNVNFSVGQFGNNVNRQVNVTDAFSMNKGNHLLKFGFDFRRLTPIQAPPSSFMVNAWFTSDAMVSGETPGILEALLDKSDIRQLYHNFSAFAQDTWKLTPRLTLTYGIRWDYNPPPSETNGDANAPYAISEITDLSTATLLPRGSPLWHADWKNFAPRVGLAYQFGADRERPIVLRAGFGQFYDLGTDTAGFLDNGEGWFPYSTATLLCYLGTGPACNSGVPYQGPEPAFTFTAANYDAMRAFDPHLKLPYSLEWNVALEKTLSPNQTIQLTYLGSVGRRLLRDDIDNNTNPATFDLYAGIYITRNTAYANYNAMQLQFQRRLSHGLQALASYSWSHSLDVKSSNVTYSSPGLPASLYNVRQDYGNSDFDIRQGFSAALTYNVPTLNIHNWVARNTLRDWSVDSINSAHSGRPFNVVYTPAVPGAFTDNVGASFLFRPDQVPGQAVWINDSTIPGGKKLNPAAFSIPATVVQGSEGRNNIGGFPLVQLDLAVRRQFNLGERINLQFRTEAFNYINHPNFGNPLNNIGTCALGVPCTPVFGWGTSQAMLNQNLGSSNIHGTSFNALYQQGGPRSLQVSLKLQF